MNHVTIGNITFLLILGTFVMVLGLIAGWWTA